MEEVMDKGALDKTRPIIRELLPETYSMITDDEINEILSSLYKNVFLVPASVDQLGYLNERQEALCNRCGSCCRELEYILFSSEELKLIAKKQKVSVTTLKRKLKARPSNKFRVEFKKFKQTAWLISGRPCPFLRAPAYCTIYHYRPSTCKYFPMTKFMDQWLMGQFPELLIEPFCDVPFKLFAELVVGIVIANRELGL